MRRALASVSSRPRAPRSCLHPSIAMSVGRTEWEEPLPTLTVRAWAFGTVLAATDVLPARFAGLSDREARAHLFADMDAGLAARLAPADVLVAEEHHGD